MMSTNLGVNLMEKMVAQGGELAMQLLAIILPCTDKEALDRLDALPIIHKFRPLPIIELPVVVGIHQDTRRPNAIMFQLGHESISYHNPTPTHDFGDKFLVQRLPAQINEDGTPSELCKKLQKDPHAYITAAIGADRLDQTRTVKPSRCERPKNAREDDGERRDSFITCAAG